MDPALLKEREAFLKRAKSTPTVEKRKAPRPSDGPEKKAKKAKMRAPPPAKPPSQLDYKLTQGSSLYKFGVLAKIVKHMKARHQSGMNDPLDLEEVLDETNQLDITTKMRHWLSTQSLLNNPKITVVHEDGLTKYAFKPKFDVRDKRGLVKLLKDYDLHGKGGILLEDVEESLPQVHKMVKSLSDYVVFVTRPHDKKQVLFYNDRQCRLTVDEEFQKLWRSVGVEGLDDAKIEDYLAKHGISTMEGAQLKKLSTVQRRKKGKQRAHSFKKHNDHLDGLLQDYSENGTNKP